MASNYAKKIAHISGKIFMDIGYKHPANVTKIVKLFREKARPQIMADWYSPVEELDRIYKHLRILGLYRDAHEDFKDEMQRLRELRGKVKKGRSREKK